MNARTHDLGVLGLVLLSLGAGLLLPAPAFLDPGTHIWPAHLVAGVSSGLLWVAGRRWHRSGDIRLWVRTALGTLLAALAALLLYRFLVETWTCRYYGSLRIVGSELMPHAARYLNASSPLTCGEVLKVFTGRREEIWTHGSLVRREILLTLSFASVLPLVAACAIATLQALRCSRTAGKRSAASPRLLARRNPVRPLALSLSRIVLSHETILRHAQTTLRAPELVEIPGSASALDLWLAVLRRAEMEAAVQALVESVLDENPAAEALKAALRDWRNRASSHGALGQTGVAAP